MTPALHRLLIAPEIIVVDLADHALRALALALLAEHPLIEDESAAHDDAPVQRRARALLRRARALRRALDDYRTQVERVLRPPDEPDLPF
jgi:hypothetical protein